MKDVTKPEMISGVLQRNQELISAANAALAKGFALSAADFLSIVENNLSQITYFEEMIQVLSIGESTHYLRSKTILN